MGMRNGEMGTGKGRRCLSNICKEHSRLNVTVSHVIS